MLVSAVYLEVESVDRHELLMPGSRSISTNLRIYKHSSIRKHSGVGSSIQTLPIHFSPKAHPAS